MPFCHKPLRVRFISSEFRSKTHYVRITLVPDDPLQHECHVENPMIKS